MRKFIFFITVLLLLPTAVANANVAYDYKNGFFDNNSAYTSTCDKKIIDNDPNSESTVFKCEIKFATPTNVKKYYWKHYKENDEDYMVIKFYMTDGKNTSHRTSGAEKRINEELLSISGAGLEVNKIELYPVGNSVKIYEFEIFDEIYAESVKNLKAVSVDNSIKINYDPVSSKDSVFVKYEYLIDEKVIGSSTKIGSNEYTFANVKNGDYKVSVRTVYADGEVTTTTDVNVNYVDKPPGNVANLTAAVKDANSVVLNFTMPVDADFSHLEIYRDGKLIADNYKTTNYTDANLERGKTYTYKIISVDVAGNKSDGATISQKIDAAKKEVTTLRATTTDDNVSLTWSNSETYDHITIYRKENKTVFSLFSNDYTQLAQVNANKYDDKSVAADTAYIYKVTMTKSGRESDGVTVSAKTQKQKITGGGVNPIDPTNPKTDYEVTWTKPTTGKIKIVVGGKDYKTVDAALLKATIKNADMKFDFFGNPDVQLIPVDSNGNQNGDPVKPPINGGNGGNTGGMLPPPGALKNVIDVEEMLKIAMPLLGLVAGFVLLNLAFRFVPKIIRTITTAANQKRGDENGK